jgi:hypothetical protein
MKPTAKGSSQDSLSGASSARRTGSHPRSRSGAGTGAENVAAIGADPDRTRGALQHIGGSRPDDWNDLIAAETVQALCVRDTDGPIDDGQIDAGISGLIGVAPRDETDGMKSEE